MKGLTASTWLVKYGLASQKEAIKLVQRGKVKFKNKSLTYQMDKKSDDWITAKTRIKYNINKEDILIIE